MKSSRKCVAAFVGTVSAAGLVMVTPSTAAAHDVTYAGPTACGPASVQSCGYGGVRGGHTWLFACDTSSSGTGYAILYELRSGKTGKVVDRNGSKNGCGGRYVTNGSDPVVNFNLCDITQSFCLNPAPA